MIYICTHNSRRSHFGQLWAQVSAYYFQIEPFASYSGGTEATAFHPHAIRAAREAGFEVTEKESGVNPIYEVSYASNTPPMEVFSKKYDQSPNPSKSFGAIMTCSSADADCPLVLGADLRVATTYEDPKAFDNTPLEEEQYGERCRQIATETAFVFKSL
ncbi:hypothetical protein E1171_12505 [Cytophagales bacterium RKSG123]|nr:hypothetical protein [Xanthovirga aplysinae]